MRKTSAVPLFRARILWPLLGAFTLVNALLAFAPLPFPWKAVLAFIGIGIPLAVLLGRRKDLAVQPLWQEELFSSPPVWVLFLFILAAACFRFIHLTTLSLWPLTDEAKSAYFAMQLASQGWGSARLLYDFSQLPPLYIWLEGLFFKCSGVSLFSLWCFPAILSLAVVPVFYGAARSYFSKSFALFLAGLMAFGFWPLYVGRFSHQGGLLLLWECLVFWLAGKLETFNSSGFLLGLLAGAGFYTFTSWPSVALVLTLWVLFFHWRAFLSFLAGMFLIYLPLGMAWLQRGYGGYIHYVGRFHSGGAWGSQILMGFWDLCAFFWKSCVPENLFAYKPFWGGYLNPLWGACLFLGILIFLRQASGTQIKFWSFAVLLFYLPGFLTGGVEMFRILPILPPLLAGVALGLSSLLSSLKRSWRWPVLGLFLLLSLGMDGYHLLGAYAGVWTHPKDNWFGSKSLDRLRAYGILEDLHKKAGPGWVLSELVPDLYDQSLSIATYEFNVGENPKLDPAQAQWAALLINCNYEPFLSKDFPQARWIRLTPDMGWPDGGLMLGLIPLPCSNPALLERLIQANQASHGLVPFVFDNRDYLSRQPVVEKLGSFYPLFKGDPFLESCFWEKIADNAYGDRDYEAQVAALRQAVEKGCPTAHLYNNLGALYFRHGRFKEARGAFGKALHCKVNDTSAADGLALLEKTEKTGQLPKD